jgi:hypothetical protein
MPVALALPPRCRVGDRRAAHCTPRLSHGAFHLRGRGSLRGPKRSREDEARALDDVARVLLVTLRAPGSPARFPPGSGKPGDGSGRPRPFLDATSRKVAPSRGSRCLLPRRNPYASGGLLLRARLDRASVTWPPWRLCSGGRAPFFSPSRRPPLTRTALRRGSTRRTRESRSPGGTTSRSARHGIYDRISSRADVPRTS